MIIATLAAAFALQSAGDIEASCKAFQAEHGGSGGLRVCVGKLIAADDDLLAELMTITTPEDSGERVRRDEADAEGLRGVGGTPPSHYGSFNASPRA